MSRRRKQARRPPPRRSAQSTLPDWVWGAGIGVVFLAVAGFVILMNGFLGSGGGGNCGKPLAPLGVSDISADGFAAEDAGLAEVISMLNAGKTGDAESAFYGDVHNFTHNADPPIREKDPELAKQLCEQVIVVEEDLVSTVSPLDLSFKVAKIQELLREGAVLLGYPRPE